MRYLIELNIPMENNPLSKSIGGLLVEILMKNQFLKPVGNFDDVPLIVQIEI